MAGAGTKLRPHTYTQPKALIPIAGKTVLSIIVDQLRSAGINDFVFVVGYLGDKIQDYVKETFEGINASFVLQGEREGLGHAVMLTKEIVGDDEVMIVLGDTICEYDVKELLQSSASVLGIKKVDDPRSFGVAEVDEEGIITKVVEKPQIPKSNMALVGIYKIKESKMLFECLEANYREGVKNRDEYSLTDALECMITKGTRFQSFKVLNWFDCGNKESLLESNSTLLKKFGTSISPDHRFENVIVVEPVSIGKNCEIKNSIMSESRVAGFVFTMLPVLHDKLNTASSSAAPPGVVEVSSQYSRKLI